MVEIEIIERPVLKPDTKTNKATQQKLLNSISEESQVVVHCSYTATFFYNRIRIWKSTFLFPRNSSKKSKLLHYENITLYPTWMPIEVGKTIVFTLIFTALPKGCKVFDLIEEIPEPGGFEIRNIQRNNTDVYFIKIK